MIESVGIIGLGKMGHPMARHLLAGGFAVAGYDIDSARVAAAQELGVRICDSPRTVAEAADLVIVIVGFDFEVLAALRGPEGVYAGLREKGMVAVASTVSLDTMQIIAGETEAARPGCRVLDIPICRGEPAAEAGELLLLAGGAAEDFERARPALETFSSDLYLLGATGAGQVGKLVNNLLLWACISANYEGLKLGAALGVDEGLLREALLKSSGRNWALETWHRPRDMPWAEKDMAIVIEEADKSRISLPMCGVVKEVVKAIKYERGLPTPGARGCE